MDDHTHRSNDEGHGNDSSRGDAHGGDHGHTHEHGGHCSQCRPSGSSQYGWVWMVGIIVVVAIALYVLQRNVPETSPADVAGGASVVAVAVEAQAPGVYNVSLPSVVPDGAIFSVDWDVSAPEETTITHTAVHWGVASASAFGDYPNATQEYYSGEFQIPAHFETNVATPKGAEAVYLRAHATIDGVDYESEEFVVPVSE